MVLGVNMAEIFGKKHETPIKKHEKKPLESIKIKISKITLRHVFKIDMVYISTTLCNVACIQSMKRTSIAPAGGDCDDTEEVGTVTSASMSQGHQCLCSPIGSNFSFIGT